uniref:Uncharacterized protein n=1 Tax=Rhizophora mucronata TaxID=61149 RepID=A0A2P2P3I3_RHIMU
MTLSMICEKQWKDFWSLLRNKNKLAQQKFELCLVVAVVVLLDAW